MKAALHAVLIWILGLAAAQAATITIINMDGAGEGLNDPASFAPTGGNNATTLGAARLNVLNEAARVWGLQLSSAVTIVVEAKFEPLDCSASSGVLGSAGPMYAFTGFSGGLSNVLYPAALADAITGTNNNGRDDIQAQFNSLIAGSSSCLGGRSFYLGFDHQLPSNQYFDLLNVVLHELAHGLGFYSFVNQDGTGTGSQLGIFDQLVYSETYGKFWPQMTATERAASSISNGSLVWNGSAVNSQLPTMSAGLSAGGHLKLYAPTTWDDGSSVSHWDTAASPNLLMEPFLTANAGGFTDLTGCVLKDLGWTGTRCPDNVPVALPQTVNSTEDLPVQVTLLGVSPNNSSALTYAVVSQPVRGVLTQTSSVVFTYTPNANVNGTDSFTFQVTNSSGTPSLPATVTINIAAVNDAPVAVAGSVTTTGAAVAVTLSASDIDSSTLTYAVVSGPAHGTLSGTAPALTYTPNAGFSGSDSFTFKANDGTADSNTATFSISVTGPASSAAPAAGGGGGGSLDMLTSALLLLLAALQGWRRVVASKGRTVDTYTRSAASVATLH